MIYTATTPEVGQILGQFYANQDDWPVWVNSCKTLTPDSCIWILSDNYGDDMPKERFVLYLEDFVPSLQHVTDKITEQTGAKEVTLVPVLQPQPFEQAQPVTTATVYQPPEDSDFMNYAAQTGFYFVFLAAYEASDE